MEGLPADVLASLLEELPDQTALVALTSMLPFQASACLEALPTTKAIGYLSQLSAINAASILRSVDREKSRKLLGKLPKRQAIPISRRLNYSQQLIGAWMDPDIQPLPIGATVGEAKKRLTSQNQNYAVTYAVDQGNAVLGAVPIMDVLQHGVDSESLAALVEPNVRTISASTRLNQALNDRGWAQNDILPVVDHRVQLIGVLRYIELLQAISKDTTAQHQFIAESNFLGLTEVCYVGLARLVSMTLADHSNPKKDPI